MVIKSHHESEDSKKKGIALRAVQNKSSSESESEEFDDTEIAAFSKKFSKFLRRKRLKNSDSTQLTCFQCNKKGHIKRDCPQLARYAKKDYEKKSGVKKLIKKFSKDEKEEQKPKKKVFRKKKALNATWDDSDSSESESTSDSDFDEEAHTCFMAKSEHEEEAFATETKVTSNDNISLYSELLAAYEELYEESLQIKKENIELKRERSTFKEERKILMDEVKNFENKISNLESEMKELRKSTESLVEDLSKFTKGKQNLEKILATKSQTNKQGLGYIPNGSTSKNSKEIVFVASSTGQVDDKKFEASSSKSQNKSFTTDTASSEYSSTFGYSNMRSTNIIGYEYKNSVFTHNRQPVNSPHRKKSHTYFYYAFNYGQYGRSGIPNRKGPYRWVPKHNF
jgi:hypothetical protein